ncbi:MAG TPA: L,D-transpeptidase [Coleofasciculaceae cyanobacterium]
MPLRHAARVYVGTALLLLVTASPSWAQVSTSQALNSKDRAAPAATPEAASRSAALRYSPSLPDLPPIQPIFPEVLSTRLVLKIGERKVYVYQGNQLKASYPVAVGRAGWETPTGNFQVRAMVKNPGWTNPFTGEVMPPGSDSPLGERWIEFWTDGQNAIGFHGTPDRDSVGRAASHGCVRMLNEDIRQLYAIVQLGTPVAVEP